MSQLFGDRLFSSLSKETPRPGMLLIAAPQPSSTQSLAAADDATSRLIMPLQRSVILLLEVNPSGAIGVDLTTRSDTAVHNVLENWEDLIAPPQAFYIGGPVANDTILGIGIKKNSVDLSKTDRVMPIKHRFVSVDLDADPEEVAQYVESVRLFAGYCGWSANQLQEEYDNGCWYVAHGLIDDLVAGGTVDVWGQAMRRQEWPLPLFSTHPVLPDLN